MTKPLAVFAANDQQAVDVLESCEIAGLLVPDEVAIVGAENYLNSFCVAFKQATGMSPKQFRDSYARSS